jgi:membrane-bound lytic murein transglycosylase D
MVTRKSLGSLLFLGACASDPTNLRDPASSSMQEKIPKVVVPRSVDEEELSEARELQKAAQEEDVLALPKTKQGTRYGQIPYVDNPMVRKWMDYFTNKDKERFLRFLGRGEVYRSLVQAILKEEGLPEDLFYLALIESGYTVQATSHAVYAGNRDSLWVKNRFLR